MSRLIPGLILLCVGTVITATGFGQDQKEALWCVYPGGEGPGKGKHIVLISGDEEYRSEEALPMLGKILSVRHGFKCTVLFAINPEDGTIDPNNQKNIPGMKAVESADLVIMALRFRNLPDEDMKYLDDYLNAGKPIIGLRTSTHAFRFEKDRGGPYAKYGFSSKEWKGGFGKQVLGETWVNHHGGHKTQATRGIIKEESKDHPILRDVDDVFGPTDVYGIRKLPDNATVLMYGQVLEGMAPDSKPLAGKKNDPMMPVFWIREYSSGSRIVCTTMGASTDFESEGLRRAVVNSCYWCLQMDDTIPMNSDVRVVDKYEPTMYGFNGFAKGMRPSDYDLKSDK